jgi:hypothetical protein
MSMAPKDTATAERAIAGPPETWEAPLPPRPDPAAAPLPAPAAQAARTAPAAQAARTAPAAQAARTAPAAQTAQAALASVEAEMERQGAIMRAAARTGSWETVEGAGRAMAGQYTLGLFRRLLAVVLRR